MVADFANPVDFSKIAAQKPLNLAERAFVAHMAEGKPCILGVTRPRPGDKDAHVIRADLIRFFALGGSDENPLKGGVIKLRGALVPDALHLNYTRLPYTLVFNDCHFNDVINMGHSECHYLDLSGSCLRRGLNGQGMTVHKSVLMCRSYALGSDVFLSEGGVFLFAANIGGGLHCNGGKFKAGMHNENGAIAGDGAKIGGNLFLRDGFSAEGGVRFLGASIGVDLDCTDGKFVNKRGCALAVDGAKINGKMSLSQGFFAEGDVAVQLSGVDIAGGLDCYGGTFKGDVIAQDAKIKKALVWLEVQGCGTVRLPYAAVGVVADDEETLRESLRKFTFHLDGFSYTRFANIVKVKSRIAWLNNRPKDVPFSPQPFEQAAKVLFAMGHDSDAREVLLEKERRLTEHGGISGLRKFARRYIWDCFAGYGYRLRRTIAWSAAVILAGTGIFDYADDFCHIVPSQPAVVVSDKYADAQTHKCAIESAPTKETVRLFPDYPKFQPFMYSVDVFFPFFALHQEPYWEPKAGEGNEIVLYLLRMWFWFEVAAGWLLTSLLVLSVTGLLRPRQSSGGE